MARCPGERLRKCDVIDMEGNPVSVGEVGPADSVHERQGLRGADSMEVMHWEASRNKTDKNYLSKRLDSTTDEEPRTGRE